MPKRKAAPSEPGEKPKTADDFILELADAILHGDVHDVRCKLGLTHGKAAMRRFEEEALSMLTADSETAQKAMYRHNVLRLQLAFGTALRLGDVGPAVAALKELNALMNLYAIGQQGGQSLDDEAGNLTNEELRTELLRELAAMERRGEVIVN